MVEKDTFILRKMDFGEGALNPSYNMYINMVKDWPWSSVHRYVKEGVYPDDRGVKPGMKLIDVSRGE